MWQSPKKSAVIIKNITYRTYEHGTAFSQTVNGDISKLPFKLESIVSLEPVGYVRDWRIGRLTLTLSHSSSNILYVLDSATFDIQPNQKAMEIKNSLTHPPQSPIGIDAVLPDLIINYDPHSLLRHLPDLPYMTPESYPGLVSPEFFEK